jgi:hypothetical protein
MNVKINNLELAKYKNYRLLFLFFNDEDKK